MHKELERIREHRREISNVALRMSNLLSATGVHETPARYQSVIRDAAALRKMWGNHRRILSALFPIVVAGDIHFVDLFDRMMNDNAAVEEMLERLVSSRWPRSAHMGLNSIRSVTAQTLSLVVRQLETEESLFQMLSRQGHLVAHVGSASSATQDTLSI